MFISMASFVATSNNVQPRKIAANKENLVVALNRNKKIFPKGEPQTLLQCSQDDDAVAPFDKGLVHMVIGAYNNHFNLVLRPDDVWQAIVTQLSFFVNAHGEELRNKFVSHEGKKQLTIISPNTFSTTDFGECARRMVQEQIIDNIKDKSLVDWLLPSFSTTQERDRIAAAVTVMATLQKYFEYRICCECGIPRVTLLGKPEDWQALRQRIDRLSEFDVAPEGYLARWQAMLTPILDGFVAQTKPGADASEALAFWDRVCQNVGGGSGPVYYSGWITVFAVFKHDGTWQGDLVGKKGKPVEWPVIDSNDLPVGWASVPVLVEDEMGKKYNCMMHAGQFVASFPDEYSLQPRSDWCMTCPSKLEM